MKPSIEKLLKFFILESERGYDNQAVLGGLERMLDHWQAQARSDHLPEDIIQAVNTRINDYSRLSPKSRSEALDGLWQRIVRTEGAPAMRFEFIDEPEDTGIAQQETEIPAPEPPVDPGPSGRASGKEASSESDESIDLNKTGPAPETAESGITQPSEPAALDAPVSVLQGVGPHHSKNLQQLGITNLRDLLYYFPRRYDDYSQLKPINRLRYGEEVTVIGTIQSIHTRSLKGGKSKLVEVIVSDGSGALRANWFNQPWIARNFQKDFQIVLAGKIDQYLGRLTMNNPEWEPLENQHLNTSRIVPIYPLTSNITQRWLRNLMNQVVSFWAPRISDPLPGEIRQKEDLLDLPHALIQIHFPDSIEEVRRARYRIAFDEIFLLQLGVLQQKKTWQERTGEVFQFDDQWWDEKIAHLPFELTEAQRNTMQDVRNDLVSGHPMNRLVQGDVGSGKTVIATMAALAVAQHGAQSALMAPTSILAEQHYHSLVELLSKQISSEHQAHQENNVETIRLLLGSTPESEKSAIRAGLADGSIKIVVGTHALIEDPIQFSNLQLVIVDEQHRFGVEQRAKLRSKGTNPHLMVLTATPIPRSLALTIYGDLDLSVIDELPPGRQVVDTYVITPFERERAYTLIRSQIEQGRQAFMIYPLVEESDKSISKAAVEEHKILQEEVFPKFEIGLLHGRLPADEKENVMTRFRKGDYQILVSTSVVEVGVDVSNATVMLIEGAHRFGLAQLHQFRGRVGRGSDKSYCILIPDSEEAIENERLKVMVETNDGFKLAEYDLEQRGPGQFLGTRQSGYTDLKIANLTDIKLISHARRSAQFLFESDPDLVLPEHQLLADAFHQAWSGSKGDIS